ncbi:hypothetical protein M405DRAFT_838028 [Rhizopogon salebrosus TDB-379]|nr:hypothetical protein M405DRAFT_838028 [Rhizopogon salebrosus TDB-379]
MSMTRKKLDAGEYPNATKFSEDCKLMIRNCFVFNPVGMPVISSLSVTPAPSPSAVQNITMTSPTMHTLLWRRGLNDELNCNACGLYCNLHKCPCQKLMPAVRSGLYHKFHSSARPTSVKSDIICKHIHHDAFYHLNKPFVQIHAMAIVSTMCTEKTGTLTRVVSDSCKSVRKLKDNKARTNTNEVYLCAPCATRSLPSTTTAFEDIEEDTGERMFMGRAQLNFAKELGWPTYKETRDAAETIQMIPFSGDQTDAVVRHACPYVKGASETLTSRVSAVNKDYGHLDVVSISGRRSCRVWTTDTKIPRTQMATSEPLIPTTSPALMPRRGLNVPVNQLPTSFALHPEVTDFTASLLIDVAKALHLTNCYVNGFPTLNNADMVLKMLRAQLLTLYLLRRLGRGLSSLRVTPSNLPTRIPSASGWSATPEPVYHVTPLQHNNPFPFPSSVPHPHTNPPYPSPTPTMKWLPRLRNTSRWYRVPKAGIRMYYWFNVRLQFHDEGKQEKRTLCETGVSMEHACNIWSLQYRDMCQMAIVFW